MPELPEVETVARGLRRRVLGRKILSVSVKHPRSTRPEPPGKFTRQLTDRVILRIWRNGKWIGVRLTGDLTLWAHLGMTGRFLWNDPDPYTRVIFKLDGPATLYFSDIRTLGRFAVGPSRQPEPPGVTLGIDPIRHGVSPEYLHQLLQSRSVAIKDLLLNQQVVSGIGNIYATEILFDAGIHPLRPANSLNRRQCARLAQSTVSCLAQAVRWGGTTISDFLTLEGYPGGFEQHIRIYGKHGQPCPQCGTILQRYLLHARSGVFCPRCQK
jgi:formamidopyrimidine-DNA glycosylase